MVIGDIGSTHLLFSIFVPFHSCSIQSRNGTGLEWERNRNGTGMERERNRNGTGTERKWSGNGTERNGTGTEMEQKLNGRSMNAQFMVPGLLYD